MYVVVNHAKSAEDHSVENYNEVGLLYIYYNTEIRSNLQVQY